MSAAHWMMGLVMGAAAASFAQGGMTAAARGATYYVDFDGGKDTNGGTKVDEALKHAPGDRMAEGVAKGLKLDPGDTVVFKGGVSYRGTIAMPAGGAEGKPVVFDGNTAGNFGQGRAMIDGSELITGWKPCASAQECGGNPNWKHIYVAGLPGDVEPLAANVFEGTGGGKLAWTAQEPNLKDPFYLDDLSTYRKVDAKNVTESSVRDDTNLTQGDPHAWDGAIVLFWAKANLVYQRAVTGFDPATHTLRFKKVPEGIYTDRPSLYAIANHLRVLDVPGENVISEKSGGADGMRKIYYWPQSNGDINSLGITYSARREGFDIAGKSYVTIQGFIVQKQGGERAEAMSNSGGKVTGLVVRDNVVRWCRSSERSNAVNLPNLEHAIIDGNHVDENVRSRGLAFNKGDDIVVSNNRLKKNGGTGIVFFGCSNSKMLHNTVLDHNGVHANGLTVYSGSTNVLIEDNTVLNSNIGFTAQDGNGITIRYNLFEGSGDQMPLCLWGGSPLKNITIENNTCVRRGPNPDWTGGIFSSVKDASGFVIRNNIIDGIAGDTYPEDLILTNNLYTQMGAWQKKTNRPLGEGEKLETDLSKIFVDPAGKDFHLKAGSPAIGAGVDIGAKADLAGTAVPTGKTPDVGAFQHKP